MGPNDHQRVQLHLIQLDDQQAALIWRLSQQRNQHIRQSKHGRRHKSQHGKRPESMIMKLLKRRRSVIFIILMIFDREESSKLNWRNESNLTCKNWLRSMHWKLFLMNNKWMICPAECKGFPFARGGTC